MRISEPSYEEKISNSRLGLQLAYCLPLLNFSSSVGLFAHPPTGIVVSQTRHRLLHLILRPCGSSTLTGVFSVFRPGVNGRHVHQTNTGAKR
jgi:hypothetical protein